MAFRFTDTTLIEVFLPYFSFLLTFKKSKINSSIEFYFKQIFPHYYLLSQSDLKISHIFFFFIIRLIFFYNVRPLSLDITNVYHSAIVYHSFQTAHKYGTSKQFFIKNRQMKIVANCLNSINLKYLCFYNKNKIELIPRVLR